MDKQTVFWAREADEMLEELGCGREGLSSAEAAARLQQYGPNRLSKQHRKGPMALFLGQFKSPITLILLFATGISLVVHDYADSVIILVIVLISALLGFFQEYNAGNAVNKLLDIVRVKTRLRRDGQDMELPVEDVVPGDIVSLSAGDMIPADLLLLSGNALQVDESSLTGESFPAEKAPGKVPAASPIAQRTNALFMGTHVISGEGKALVVRTGSGTEFGAIAGRLSRQEGETDFERGVRRFGSLLMEITVLLLMAIFVINMFLGKPVLDSFVFSLALAVGMTPQLLPAIISVNLSRGAKEMARQQVIVKKLSAIEDFGTMEVLCSDKTGTITQGQVRLDMAADITGQASELVALCAWLNAHFQSSYQNQIDQAILAALPQQGAGFAKIGEIPYSFATRRMGVMLETPETSPFGKGRVLMMKGAVKNLLDACDKALDQKGQAQPMAELRPSILNQYEAFSQQGFRTLGVAYKALGDDAAGERGEAGLSFAGFLCLSDPLKPGIVDTIAALRGLGVQLKVITGDNRLIAAHIAGQLGLPPDQVISGEEIDGMSDGALVKNAADAMIFAEIAPNQKERIILALKKGGQVVGYMGDGINDAAALHAADVGISVDTAADVAKDAATIVLLEQDLKVLIAGVREGRKTFANTMKYVFMATSANFGNMFSMAGASLFLPFLPLRSTQVLLTNMMTDFPEMQIAADRVDEEMLSRAQRWDLGFIKRFMLMFGSLSSVFDYLTFAVLLLVFRADETMFQTGWFTESVISAATIVFVVRSRQPLGKSRPGRGLAVATLAVVLATLALPYTPLAPILGFAPLPWPVLLTLLAVVALYLLSGEMLKKAFYRWEAKRARNH